MIVVIIIVGATVGVPMKIYQKSGELKIFRVY